MSRETSNDNQVAARKCHAVVAVDVPDEAEMETQTVVINFDDVKDSDNIKDREGSTQKTDMLKLCPTCNKETSNITRHLELHEKWGAIHKCELCPREYGRKSHLSRHMKLHSTGSKPHVCPICKKGFNYKQYLKFHQRLHTGEKPHLCEVCGSSFSHPSGLRKHSRVHTGEKPYHCARCGKDFALSNALKIHEEIHNGPVWCPTCGRQFSCDWYKNLHVKRVHNKEETPVANAVNGKYICQICGKVLRSQFALELHLARLDEHRLCGCRICGQEMMKSHLNEHVLRSHRNHYTFERFVCKHPGCVRRYRSWSGLKYHMFSHSGKTPYPCKLCNKGFRTRGDLYRHEKCHKAWERLKFHCKKCGNVVHRRRKLRNTDLGLAKLCDTCKKVPAKKLAAKRCVRCGAVVRTGTSQNPEVCSLCEHMEAVQKIVSGKCVKCRKLFILEKVPEKESMTLCEPCRTKVTCLDCGDIFIRHGRPKGRGYCQACTKKRMKCNRCGAISEHETIKCPNWQTKALQCKDCGKLYFSIDRKAKHNCNFKPGVLPHIRTVAMKPVKVQLPAINDKATQTLPQKVNVVKKEQVLNRNEEVSETKLELFKDIANVERSNDKATQTLMQKVVVEEEQVLNGNLNVSGTKEALCKDVANVQTSSTSVSQMTKPFEIKENPCADGPTSSFLINIGHSHALVNVFCISQPLSVRRTTTD